MDKKWLIKADFDNIMQLITKTTIALSSINSINKFVIRKLNSILNYFSLKTLKTTFFFRGEGEISLDKFYLTKYLCNITRLNV